MLDFSRKEALSVQEKTFHSYGVFRISGGAFYKHYTPRSLKSILYLQKKFAPPNGWMKAAFRTAPIAVLINCGAKFRYYKLQLQLFKS